MMRSGGMLRDGRPACTASRCREVLGLRQAFCLFHGKCGIRAIQGADRTGRTEYAKQLRAHISRRQAATSAVWRTSQARQNPPRTDHGRAGSSCGSFADDPTRYRGRRPDFGDWQLHARDGCPRRVEGLGVTSRRSRACACQPKSHAEATDRGRASGQWQEPRIAGPPEPRAAPRGSAPHEEEPGVDSESPGDPERLEGERRLALAGPVG